MNLQPAHRSHMQLIVFSLFLNKLAKIKVLNMKKIFLEYSPT
jgi:hypothetical protein